MELRNHLMSCHCFLLVLSSVVISLRGVLANGTVTVESLTIFQTHEWFRKPSVYFRCKGEEKVHLPDVVEKGREYKFIGEESWQPLTSLGGSKCKRCGLYEEDQFKPDDTFDEWELCPTDFISNAEGRYNHFKEKEIDITLLCDGCDSYDSEESDQSEDLDTHEDKNSVKKKSALVILLAFFGFVLLIVIATVGYMKWQKKKREEQQARFMKLFEEDDDLEAELGLRD